MFFLARLEFLIWNWGQVKEAGLGDLFSVIMHGMRFDAASTSMILAPLVLFTLFPWSDRMEGFWKFVAFSFFVLTQIPLFILNVGDTELINFVGRRFTFDTLFLLHELQGKTSAFAITYWHLVIVNTLLVLFFIYGVYKIIYKNGHKDSWKFYSPILSKRAYTRFAIFGFIIVLGIFVGIRGGFQSRPLSFVMANIFDKAILNNAILNTPFVFMKSVGVPGIENVIYFEDREKMIGELNGSLSGSLLEGHRPSAPQNVVILILESFGEEYIGRNESGQSFTPFLDSLKEKSLNFTNSYANGRRSIEGVISVLSGVPSLMDKPFVSSQYTGNKLIALGTMVKQNGYQTSFYHGGDNGTMHFDSFSPWAGFEKYYGFKEYPEPSHHDGHWGVWDHIYLPWMAKNLSLNTKPFLATVFTLSSHHPFKIPDDLQSRFNKGPNSMMNAVEYSDYAVQLFFEEAQKQPWFQNTLFVITADHTSLHYRKSYENDQGNYRIPLIFYHPNFQFPSVDTTNVVQQIDIPSSVLDFLGIAEQERNYLTSSVFTPGEKYALVHLAGRYTLFGKDHVLTWTKGTSDFRLFAATDWTQEQELVSPEYAEIKSKLIGKLRAQKQYFSEGMKDNKILYPLRAMNTSPADITQTQPN